jgi:hypothetical protein
VKSNLFLNNLSVHLGIQAEMLLATSVVTSRAENITELFAVTVARAFSNEASEGDLCTRA